MKFAQLKWIGLALLATGLSAGGAVGRGRGVGRRIRLSTEASPVAAVGRRTRSKPPRPRQPSQRSAQAVENDRRATARLEEQIDRIYRLSGIAPRPSVGASDASTLDRLEAKLESS